MNRFIVALAGAIIMLPAAALAQAPTFSLDPDGQRDPAAEQRAREIDRAYQAAKEKQPATPAAKASSDPWGGVRPSAQESKPKPATKPHAQAQPKSQ
jgi:hypothetical protein